eukprot:GHVN01028591.1.p1 GENE.GHVN01028591.1~~GHVN01028591.1.p1  ORF type:complete len:632 (-),score=169.41 GHVN01028591.1:124-2019(-)
MGNQPCRLPKDNSVRGEFMTEEVHIEEVIEETDEPISSPRDIPDEAYLMDNSLLSTPKAKTPHYLLPGSRGKTFHSIYLKLFIVSERTYGDVWLCQNLLSVEQSNDDETVRQMCSPPQPPTQHSLTEAPDSLDSPDSVHSLHSPDLTSESPQRSDPSTASSINSAQLTHLTHIPNTRNSLTTHLTSHLAHHYEENPSNFLPKVYNLETLHSELGSHINRSNLVCVKIVSKVAERMGSAASTVLDEYHMIKYLNHPNVVESVELLEDRSHYYLINEACLGGELGELISFRGVDPDLLESEYDDDEYEDDDENLACSERRDSELTHLTDATHLTDQTHLTEFTHLTTFTQHQTKDRKPLAPHASSVVRLAMHSPQVSDSPHSAEVLEPPHAPDAPDCVDTKRTDAAGEYFTKRVDVLGEATAAHLIHQVLSAVKYLHNNGIVHRDIKLENLLMTDLSVKGILKVADFSVATEFDMGSTLNRQLGTSYYAAPEIFSSRYNEKVDVWSVGVVLYILLSGLPPFNGEDEEEIRRDVVFGRLRFKGPIWANRSKDCIEFISHLINRDPRKRVSASEALLHPWLTRERETYIQEVAQHLKANEPTQTASVAPPAIKVEGFNVPVNKSPWACRGGRKKN